MNHLCSGTPEPDRFKHEAPGQCLLVSIEFGALPVVAPLETEEFSWQERDCDLFTDSEIEDVISDLCRAIIQAKDTA